MIAVVDRGVVIEFTIDDVIKYHGPHSPGGVAVAYRAMEAGLPLLGDLERRHVHVRTAFGGPGARDAFEMVLRAVTGDRYVVDEALVRPDLGRERERFVFHLFTADRSVTVVLRDGFVTPEFIDLARADDRSPDQEARLDVLKRDLADRVLAAEQVFDVDG